MALGYHVSHGQTAEVRTELIMVDWEVLPRAEEKLPLFHHNLLIIA